MFSPQETSRIKTEFWTTFGKYMSPIPSAEGIKINWVNYHTQVKDVYFRMDTGMNAATIYISLEHSDAGIRELYFEQFLQLKKILQATLQEDWDWQQQAQSGDRVMARIIKQLPGVSVLSKDQWPDLISFFKPRIMALDQFWENAKYSFDGLK